MKKKNFFRKLPFKLNQEDSTEMLLSRLNEAKVNFDEGNWKHVSNEAKDLVKKMLNLDPRHRISSSNILKHPWITNIDNLPDFKLSIQDGENVRVRTLFFFSIYIFFF